MSAYLDETLYTFGNVLCKLGHCDGPRGAPEVFRWDLSAPLSIARPLETEERQPWLECQVAERLFT